MLLVVDHVLGTKALSGWVAGVISTVGLSTARGDLLLTFGLTGLGLQLLHELVVLGQGRLAVRVGQHMIRDAREQLFAHMQAWALQHHGTMPKGDAVQRLESDTRCVDQLVMRGLFPVVFSLLTLVVMFVVLLTIDVKLALVSLAIVPPMYLWLRCYARRMAPSADHARFTDSRLSTRLFEAISTIHLIKSHAREKHEQARIANLAGDNAHAWIGVGRQGTLFSVVTSTLTIVGSTLVLLLGGRAVLHGQISLGTLLLLLTYLGYVYGPLAAIANTTSSLQHAYASARRVRAAFEIDPEDHGADGARPAHGLRGEVRFDGVSFSYGNGFALDDISFTAQPGETVALVGPSGAGKSTLASLLLRFYDKSQGRITIDGVDIEDFQLTSLRQEIGIVLQDAIIASGSVADNIAYGRLDATGEQIQDAARAANAHEFIEHLSEGYDTQVGDCAARLSAVDRQRLGIARAFLKNPPILILDEPTAALDTIAEHQVVDAIKRLEEGRTTFVVAHRLSTVQHADRILVMDRGRIVAQGNHHELLKTCQLYRKLARQLEPPPKADAAPAYAA
jgi:ABC-type multidrug transport system fused ATPase/permease subunit